MSWETIKKNMEEHNGKYRPEQSTAGKSVSKEERQNNRNFWNNTRDIFVNTLKDTALDQTKNLIKTGNLNRNDIWNRVQNIANNNLNRFNNTQRNIDVNTRSQMAQNMEDFTNRKRTAMQSVSNAIQENAKKREDAKQENKALIDQANDQFRQQHPSTVNTNQKQEYVPPKAEVKLANNEEVSKAENLKRIDTAQFYKTKQDAESGNIFGYILDKASMGLQSVGDSLLNIYTTEALNMNEKAKEINKKIGAEDSEEIKKIDRNLKELTNNTKYQAKKSAISIAEQDFSKGIRTLGNASEGVGAMVPSLAVGTISPTAGLAVTGVTASGSSMKQALDEGATPEQAQKAGLLKGGVEVATEKLFGGIKFFGKGSLDDIFTDKIMNKVSSRIGKLAVRQGYDITGEVVEEHISNIAGYGIDKLVLDKDLPTLKQMIEDADETTKTTILSTLILKTIGIPINSSNLEIDNLTDKQKQDIQRVEKMLQDNDSLKQNTDKNKDYNTNQPLDSVSQQWLNRANDIINENNNSNLQQNTTNNSINPLMQQTNSQENKVAQNGNMEISDNVVSSYSGQTNSIIEAKIEGKKVGTLEYSEYNGEPSISMINVDEKYRRNGIAKKMLQELQSNYPNKEIDWGTMTTDGAKLKDAVTYNIENPEIINKQMELQQIEETLKKYEEKDKLGILTEEEGDNWNKLYDRQQLLEKELYNKKSYKNFVDLDNNLANNQKTVYNDVALGETKNIPIENLISLQTEGGYRNQEQTTNLREDISKNGIQNPIELARNNDGSISIENGNHRLQIAKELGMKEVPVKFVESWDNIGIDDNIVEKWEDIYNENNQKRAGINKSNEGTQLFERSMANNRNQLENGTTATANDRLSDKIQAYNDRASSNSTFKQNSKELGQSSSFNLQNNSKQQTNTTSQLKEVEANTQSLGYKPDIEGKQRKHYKSIIESDQVGEVGKQSAKSLLENDVYKPLSNIDTLVTANENINRNGVDSTYIAFRNKLNSNERITLQDIATGERLIQIFSQNEDFEKVNGLIQDVAMLGTELGQQVQAMSLIKKASPEGQLMYLQKVVERTNIKENTDLKVTEEMSKKILETKNETELENVMTDIAVELGEQLPVTTGDKVRSWRYLSMLGNPRTHIKNLGANVAMNVTQQLKNKVAGATEEVVGMFNKDMERTKTLRPANQDQRNFAKQDAEFMKDKIDGGGKYDIKNAIQNNKRQFDNNALNAIANFNSDMLELEDNIFLKKAYQQAMQNYMSANKLSSSDMENSSVLQKAREYASYQAQEATFHQFSALAQRLTEIENKGGIAGKALEAVVPFKKTPINIAKSGVEYSPIGLAKSLTYDLAQINKKTKEYKTKLEKGLISEAEYKTGTSKLVTKTIDDMAKGLTGTSLALLGYALKDMGILKSGNDGDDDEFKEQLGEQEYAIRIGDNTYTLDWVSPSAIPMFMGATVHDLMHSENEDNSNTLNSLMTSSAKALEPMTEMSMLQGLTSAISSYEQGSSNMLFDLGASAVSSYLGQFVPTALGQVAKTIDDKERDTSSTEKGLAKKVDQFKKQQLAKIPIASKSLPVRKDVWGNEKTRDSNPLVRAYEVGLAPYNRKKVVEDYTEKELLKVFEDTGEKSVLPGIPNKDITINKQKYRLTAEEYNKAKETFGKTSKSMLDSLVKTSEYKQLSDEQKVVAIDNIYSYAKEKIKADYAKGKKQEVETSSSYNILNELKNPTNQSEYLSYSAKIQGIEKDTEKKKILVDGKYSTTTKETIYKNTLGKEDDLYNNILAKDNININEYLNYKLQEFESDKEEDGTASGKTISGSKKKKVYDYVNGMNITKDQKLVIIGTQYKLNKNEQRELYNYINNMPKQTKKDKLEIFSKYSNNFTIYKDNTMTFK